MINERNVSSWRQNNLLKCLCTGTFDHCPKASDCESVPSGLAVRRDGLKKGTKYGDKNK